MSAALQEVSAPKTTQLPLFEGHRVTEHRLNFAGNVLLVDSDVVKGMKLGEEIEIVVRGYVSKRGHKALRDGEGNKLGAESSSVLVVQSIQAYDPD